MRLLAGLFFLFGLLFLFFPTETLYLVNIAPTVFKLADPIPMPAERLWLTMASAWYFTLSGLAYFCHVSPSQKSYFWIQISGLSACSVGLLFSFFTERQFFAYLLAGLLHGFLAIFIFSKSLLKKNRIENTT